MLFTSSIPLLISSLLSITDEGMLKYETIVDFSISLNTHTQCGWTSFLCRQCELSFPGNRNPLRKFSSQERPIQSFSSGKGTLAQSLTEEPTLPAHLLMRSWSHQRTPNSNTSSSVNCRLLPCTLLCRLQRALQLPCYSPGDWPPNEQPWEGKGL